MIFYETTVDKIFAVHEPATCPQNIWSLRVFTEIKDWPHFTCHCLNYLTFSCVHHFCYIWQVYCICSQNFRDVLFHRGYTKGRPLVTLLRENKLFPHTLTKLLLLYKYVGTSFRQIVLHALVSTHTWRWINRLWPWRSMHLRFLEKDLFFKPSL